MPYIKQEDRRKFDELIKKIIEKVDNEGELNYVITTLAKSYMSKLSEEERYQFHNQIMGILVCTLLEFYRVQTGPYEDVKRIENGDVHAVDSKNFQITP